LAALAATACADEAAHPAPPHLADTGLYADFGRRELAPGVEAFSPQYPLWTDGADKQRWIALPPGTAIDATEVDHWQFPVGTRLWKQFSFGRPVETRFMELQPDGSWLYATYHWLPDGSGAPLAPAAGLRAVAATAEGRHHDLPSIADCRLCHEGTRTPVLGFSALQLSSDRDPLAPHAAPHRDGELDLDALAGRGLIRGLDPRWLSAAPRIAARSPGERAALGYLHGNCGSCHNATGPLQRLGLRLDHPLADPANGPAPAIATAVGVPSRFALPGAALRIAGGRPDQSVLARRLASVDPLTQMPPFGRHLADTEALSLIEAWIAQDLGRACVTSPLKSHEAKSP
jgi:mono/diheme cytochrome c family protein